MNAEGVWVRDKEHGPQLKAAILKTAPPATAEGIERYLGSGMVKGEGPVLAKRLVERFGAEVLAVIEHQPGNFESTEGTPASHRVAVLPVHSGIPAFGHCPVEHHGLTFPQAKDLLRFAP